MSEETKNKKAREYAGQLVSVVRKDKVLSVIDQLSHVDDSANATYLEILHPAAVYRMTILGDKERGISVKANIRLDELKRIWLRVQFAEKTLYDQETRPKVQVSDENGAANGMLSSPAFTVRMLLGKDNIKGKTPGEVILNAADKDAAVRDLRAQYDYLKENVQKFPKNQKVMDAINMAVSYYELGSMDDMEAPKQPAEADPVIASIYSPPEKTFRKETKELSPGNTLTKAYKIGIQFNPKMNYPYRITISNQWVSVRKEDDGREKIGYMKEDVAEKVEYSFDLASDEMVDIIDNMLENKANYKSNLYVAMRKKDQELQKAKRSWKPKE